MRYFREPDCSAWLWLLIDREKRSTSRKLKGAIAETVVLRGVEPRAWFRTNPGDGAVVKVDAAKTTLERLKTKFAQMRINVSEHACACVRACGGGGWKRPASKDGFLPNSSSITVPFLANFVSPQKNIIVTPTFALTLPPHDTPLQPIPQQQQQPLTNRKRQIRESTSP